MCAHVSGSNKSVLIIVARSRSTVFRSRGAMGSLDPDTRCCYCGINRAGYILDGTAGPMCGGCFDTLAWSSWETLVRKRHQRLINCLIRSCGKTADVQLKLSRDTHLTIAAFLRLG